MKTVDFLIIGGGIIGLTVAREIKHRWPDQSVLVLEKEESVAMHASGRNSGVLHAGFYYSTDSLKAKLTHLGNRQLTQYCEEYGIAVNKCGKLVVTSSEEQLPVLLDLYSQGTKNGVPLELIDEAEAKEIEPRAKTVSKAIFSPHTSSVDPIAVTQKIKEECLDLGVQISFSNRFIHASETPQSITATSEKATIESGYLINSAGLYADKIAHQFGVGLNFRIMPFKGLYLYANENFGQLRTHVYPVPDMRNPFLGVHFTIASNDQVKIGPTATPAFWREQYDWHNHFSLDEFSETITTLTRLLSSSHSTVRAAVPKETSKYIRQLLVRQAAKLVPGAKANQFTKWGRPGIRAQLVDMSTTRLVSDFIIEKTPKTLHVLNAVSPAFTSSLPFAALICDELGTG